ncbi:MAG: hypothetical protein GY797_05850 [Deltaproteobacteria bacterium]|nr:hypothetical protein [Deltaproteobacteria bacterium]
MSTKEKIDAVVKYLKNEFPKGLIEHYMDNDLGTRSFRAYKSNEFLYVIKFHRKSWDNTTDINSLLTQLDIANSFRKFPPNSNVIATVKGVKGDYSLDLDPR